MNVHRPVAWLSQHFLKVILQDALITITSIVFIIQDTRMQQVLLEETTHLDGVKNKMKHLLNSITLLLLSTIAFGSDNRSAPNVFSSGSTISSSQMNENFNFLASEIREKDVDCEWGDNHGCY